MKVRNSKESDGDHGIDGEARELRWLEATARGDRAAFERLYLHHHGRLARFLARHTAQRDLIDEIINETFWVVWRKAADFRGDSKVSTWIIGIAYRRMLKSLRDGAGPPISSGSEMGDFAIEEELEGIDEAGQRELSDWVRRGVALLPPEQRMTMELAYYLGQSCEEISVIMNCAVGTVKARMFHARLRLRNTLPALGGGVSVNPTRKPSP
jgi:RNA polymerase sigma-70 factor (ECF subfamily)